MLASPTAIQAVVSLPAWPAFAAPLRSAKSRWSTLWADRGGRVIAWGESLLTGLEYASGKLCGVPEAIRVDERQRSANNSVCANAPSEPQFLLSLRRARSSWARRTCLCPSFETRPAGAPQDEVLAVVSRDEVLVVARQGEVLAVARHAGFRCVP